MKELELKLISPEKILFQGKVLSVQLPGTEGSFSIHPDHAPIVSSLKEGEIVYLTESGESQTTTIHSGFVEVSNNIVTVCVE